jgi:hypothetical protein
LSFTAWNEPTELLAPADVFDRHLDQSRRHAVEHRSRREHAAFQRVDDRLALPGHARLLRGVRLDLEQAPRAIR